MTKRKEPLHIRVIEGDKLSSFERKTVRIGCWGVVVGFLSLGAACVAAYLVYQQFQEMAKQTSILSQSFAKQKTDSDAASIATATQIGIMQGQLTQLQKALALTKEQFTKEERPYIWHSAIKGTIVAQGIWW